MKRKDVAVELFRHLCNHDWHGYDQRRRWGDGEGVCIVRLGGVDYELQQGDRDCSSAIISAFEAAGISCGGATYTGDMKTLMCKTGNFVWKDMSYIAQPGDVYLNIKDHTAMCMSSEPDLLGEFSITENGGIYAVQTGDQTGKESYIHYYYDYPWDGILKCVNNKEAINHKDNSVYVVQPGDTLSQIACELNVNWKTLADTNNISNPNLIYVGQKILY